LYRVRVADGSITALTDDAADDDDPTAHPTKPLVVFASDRESGGRGDHALFSYDLATGRVEALTAGPADDRRPVWSPDGTTLAFLSDREGIDDLWLWREGRVQRASRFLGPAYDPAWHPNGKALLFAGQAGWSFHLYEVPVAPIDSLWSDEDAKAGLAPPPVAVQAAESASPYPRRLSMDIAQSLVALDPALGAGGGGGMVALSDVLGNEGLYLFMSNDASSLGGFLDGMEFGVTYFNRSQRLNYGVGVFRLARIYDVDFDLFRRERRIGGTLLAAYPLSKFTRLEASTVLRHAQDHLLRSGDFRDLWLLSNYVAFVHDDARFTFHGAEGGHRLNVTTGFTRDLSTGTGDDVSLTLDGRVYRTLVEDVVWANRVVTQVSSGDDPERFYLGGPYSIRGWERRILSGTKTAFAQTELRFPILARTRLGAPLPIEFPRVNVALFADAAVAGEFGQRFERRGALGAGLYVGGGYFPVLRFDFVKRTDLRKIDPTTRTQFSIGYSF
ncbi:MAG: BamA/TamA family outer membrane protein, partial [Candidatus Eisenbacteria bacterium]